MSKSGPTAVALITAQITDAPPEVALAILDDLDTKHLHGLIGFLVGMASASVCEYAQASGKPVEEVLGYMGELAGRWTR